MQDFLRWIKKHTARLALGLCVLALVGGGVFMRQTTHEAKSVEELKAPTMATSTSTWAPVAPFLVGAPPFWTSDPVAGPCSVPRAEPLLILPHYIPAHARTERALAAWKACSSMSEVKRVIVVSPDHHHRLTTGLATLAADGYDTPLGTISTDSNLQAKFAEKGISAQTDLFYAEHGAGAFPVFIKQFFPEATFTPLVISAQATQQQVRTAADILHAELAASSTLVIVTADFSHYLSQDLSDRKDQETLAAISKRDASFLWGARDNHSDLGRGLWLALQLASPSSVFHVYDTLNSAELGGDRGRTTGFVWGWWGRN